MDKKRGFVPASVDLELASRWGRRSEAQAGLLRDTSALKSVTRCLHASMSSAVLHHVSELILTESVIPGSFAQVFFCSYLRECGKCQAVPLQPTADLGGGRVPAPSSPDTEYVEIVPSTVRGALKAAILYVVSTWPGVSLKHVCVSSCISSQVCQHTHSCLQPPLELRPQHPGHLSGGAVFPAPRMFVGGLYPCHVGTLVPLPT